MSFLVDNSLLEVLSRSYVTPLRKGSCRLVPGLLRTLPHVPFPCAVYPFAVINDSNEYNIC